MILTFFFTLFTFTSSLHDEDLICPDANAPYQIGGDGPWYGAHLSGDTSQTWDYSQRLGRYDGNILQNDTDTTCCQRCDEDPNCTAWQSTWYSSASWGYSYQCKLFSCITSMVLGEYPSRRHWVPTSSNYNVRQYVGCHQPEPKNEYCRVKNNELQCFNLTGRCIHYNTNYKIALVPDINGTIYHNLGNHGIPTEVEQYSSPKIDIWYGSYCPSEGYMPYGSIAVHNQDPRDFDFNEFFSDDNDKEFYEQGWFYLLCAIVIIFVCFICVCGYVARRNSN